MPYVDTVGDVVRATTACMTAESQLQEFGIHWLCTATGGTDQRPAIAAQLSAAFQAHLKAYLPTVATYYGVRVDIIKSLTKFAAYLLTVNTPGTGTGSPLPTQVRPLISLKTAMAGRAFHGRIYLPSPDTNALTVLGRPSAAYLIAAAGYAIPAFIPIVSSGSIWIPVIYHRTPTGPISATSTPISLSVVSNLFATQRRSGDYGRVNVLPW